MFSLLPVAFLLARTAARTSIPPFDFEAVKTLISFPSPSASTDLRHCGHSGEVDWDGDIDETREGEKIACNDRIANLERWLGRCWKF